MESRIFALTFLTPAFLGDSHQNGRWRTPPIKAQLRQWWRVAYAADHGFQVKVADMRCEEGLLFGNAWLDKAFCKSLVRIRMERWQEGTLEKAKLPSDGQIRHPEVRNQQGQLVPIGSVLYLGYGPLNPQRRKILKANAAIQADESARLHMAWPEIFPSDLRAHLEESNSALRAYPEKISKRLQHALWLMDRYGTMGGRSRNGWGSYALITPNAPALSGKAPLRPWRDCLELDWPHAIGQDEKGALIWKTEPHDNWKSLMKTLAIVKIGLRTQFVFTTGRQAPQAEERHWLSYPVTNHSVAAWGSLRLPNQLRFKVRKTPENKSVGVIFHMPHLPPKAFTPNESQIECVWRCVHAFLDAMHGAPNPRWPECSCLDQKAQQRRNTRLDAWWAHVAAADRALVKLTRIPE